MQPTVYLDYAATTPVDPRVAEAMQPYLTERFGNASSAYALGRDAASVLASARGRLAVGIGAAGPDEVVFTSCGTESDNMAVIGLATAGGRSAGHVVVSAFEHPAVLEPARWLARHGFDLTELAPHADGTVYPDDLAAALRDDTILVSVMHANNELGTVQPIAELAAVAHERGALFHTDAAQTLGKIDLDVTAVGIDAASFAGHKIYAPKGTGFLYLRRGTPIAPYLMGGGQESGLRSGTSNVAGAEALATALELMNAERPTEAPRLKALRAHLEDALVAWAEGVRITVAEAPERLPHLTHALVPGPIGSALLAHLDAAGIAVSAGSACSAGDHAASHVLAAIGCPADLASGSLRVSLGRFTTPGDVEYLIDTLAAIGQGG